MAFSKPCLLAVAFAFSAASTAHSADAIDTLEEVSDPPASSGELSGSIGAYTEYVFRGISQTEEDFSIQGTLDYTGNTGIEGLTYSVGLFASNVDFGTPDAGSYEIDIYGTLNGSVDIFEWSVGGVFYEYPDADETLEQDYFEVIASIGISLTDDFSIGGNYAYSPDFFGGIGDARWYEGTISYSLPVFEEVPLTFDAGFGRQEFNAGGDYNTWRAGLTAELSENLSAAVQYTDTNIDIFQGTTNISDERVIGSVTFNF